MHTEINSRNNASKLNINYWTTYESSLHYYFKWVHKKPCSPLSYNVVVNKIVCNVETISTNNKSPRVANVTLNQKNVTILFFVVVYFFFFFLLDLLMLNRNKVFYFIFIITSHQILKNVPQPVFHLLFYLLGNHTITIGRCLAKYRLGKH